MEHKCGTATCATGWYHESIRYMDLNYFFEIIVFIMINGAQGSVVQSWVSTNSGLKFNPMYQFLCFYISVYFNTS